MKPSSYFLLFIFLLAIAAVGFVFQARGLRPDYTFKARFLPLVVASILTVIAGASLFRELRRGKTTEQSPASETTAEAASEKLALVTGAWLVGYMVLAFLIGFLLSTLIWITAYLRTHNYGWIRSLAISLGMMIFLYVVFDLVFGITLYQGVLPIPIYSFLP